MKTFAFILYVLNPTNEYSSFVLDYDLSESDCMALHLDWVQTLDQYSTVFCYQTNGES